MTMDTEATLKELKEKIDEIGEARKDKLSIVVFSDDMDKMLAAMIIATGAGAMDMEVSLFFTFWATAALRKPEIKAKDKSFMEKMFGWMLPKGRNNLKLSKMHMGGVGTAMMKDLMKKKNTTSLDQLFEIAALTEVQINVCEMSMDLMGFKPEEIIDYPNLTYCGVATFLADAGESSVQLFI